MDYLKHPVFSKIGKWHNLPVSIY